ncbi:hypothetical protein EJ04DRAFT_520246 [Polyplosphaeria fusca]|uniref:Uncharacterized protein n=1 Tax=Polyplosphaeria fusca TaxID=682080 RepID=A0A9P4R3P6_9PLEO|nr:hypothetical protein EJ04DRAFT_520246 [Polyplosphaeria fusca]
MASVANVQQHTFKETSGRYLAQHTTSNDGSIQQANQIEGEYLRQSKAAKPSKSISTKIRRMVDIINSPKCVFKKRPRDFQTDALLVKDNIKLTQIEKNLHDAERRIADLEIANTKLKTSLADRDETITTLRLELDDLKTDQSFDLKHEAIMTHLEADIACAERSIAAKNYIIDELHAMILRLEKAGAKDGGAIKDYQEERRARHANTQTNTSKRRGQVFQQSEINILEQDLNDQKSASEAQCDTIEKRRSEIEGNAPGADNVEALEHPRQNAVSKQENTKMDEEIVPELAWGRRRPVVRSLSDGDDEAARESAFREAMMFRDQVRAERRYGVILP